jgi:DNA-binding transcriptional LysR family regulator
VANLLEDPIDLAVRIGELPDSSLVATRVGSIRRVVCGSLAYFAERSMPRAPGELGAYDCITFEGLMSPAAWTFTTGKSDVSVPIHSRLTVNTAEAAIDAAIAGLGVTRVGDLDAQALLCPRQLRARPAHRPGGGQCQI